MHCPRSSHRVRVRAECRSAATRPRIRHIAKQRRERQGVASALNDVAREFGSALGVALLGAVFATGYSNAIKSDLKGVPVDAADTARKGIASALAIANEANPYSKALFRSAQESFVHGWQHAMWAGVIVLTIVLVYVLVRGPERTSAGDCARTL